MVILLKGQTSNEKKEMYFALLKKLLWNLSCQKNI